MNTKKVRGRNLRLRGIVPVLCAVPFLSLLFAAGCANKTDGDASAAAAAPPVASTKIPPSHGPAPGDPNANAAANAAAFEAAMKKAEHK